MQRSPGASSSRSQPLRLLIPLVLVVAVVLVTLHQGDGTISWLGLGDTSPTGTTRLAGSLAPRSEHGVPEVAAAGKRACKKIKDKKRRKQCVKKAKAHNGQPPTQAPAPTTDAILPPPDASLLAAGDIAGCSNRGDEATAKLLDGLAGTIATLGDNVYESGTASEFSNCYHPSWGRHKSRTKPATGNHDYHTSGASGYFGYFTPEVQTSYYSYELGSWHIVVLNSNCTEAGGCGAGSPQETWLRQDLAAHPTACTLAYWHHPRFSFGNYGNDTRMQALWQALDAAGAEIVLAGHDHNYQRWAPLNPDGTLDRERGIRQFVVGTGGRSHYPLKTPPPANAEAFNGDTFGVLQLTLHPTSYEWQFIPEAGKSFRDAGSGECH